MKQPLITWNSHWQLETAIDSLKQPLTTWNCCWLLETAVNSLKTMFRLYWFEMSDLFSPESLTMELSSELMAVETQPPAMCRRHSSALTWTTPYLPIGVMSDHDMIWHALTSQHLNRIAWPLGPIGLAAVFELLWSWKISWPFTNFQNFEEEKNWFETQNTMGLHYPELQTLWNPQQSKLFRKHSHLTWDQKNKHPVQNEIE